MKKQSELEFETGRLTQTIVLMEEQLEQGRKRQEKTKSDLALAQEDLRENSSHSISGLGSSEGF